MVFGNWERAKSGIGSVVEPQIREIIPVHPFTGRLHVEAKGCQDSTPVVAPNCKELNQILSRLLPKLSRFRSFTAGVSFVAIAFFSTLSLALDIDEFHVYRTDFSTGGSGTPRHFGLLEETITDGAFLQY